MDLTQVQAQLYYCNTHLAIGFGCNLSWISNDYPPASALPCPLLLTGPGIRCHGDAGVKYKEQDHDIYHSCGNL